MRHDGEELANGVVAAWLDDLKRALGSVPIAVCDVRIGVFYTAAELSTGQVGVAFTPRELGAEVCCPRAAAAAPAAGRLAGQSAWDLAADALSPVVLRRAVGVAVLNALSTFAIERLGPSAGVLLRGVDALEAAGVIAEDRVAMVGSFVPFIHALRDRVTSLSVIDLHRQALGPGETELWKSPEEATEVVSRATVVILTGSTLVEGGLDGLLAAAGKARKVVIAGPTAPTWPAPFFSRGVHVLAGIQVRDSRKMLQIVSEGGSGASFSAAAAKICVVRQPLEERTGALPVSASP
jgi:uncharacterized protein (DUF4213/DUF364 family)